MLMIKKLILLILLILCLSFRASALEPMMLLSGGGVGEEAGSSICSACTPGDPTDIFCEDFEGSVDPPDSSAWCTWVESVDGTNTVTVVSHSGTWSSCTSAEKGSDAVKMTVVGAQGETASIRTSRSQDLLYQSFYWTWDEDATNILDDGDWVSIYTVERAGPGLLYKVSVLNSGGVNYIYCNYTHSGGTKGFSTGITPVDNQIYHIQVEWHRNTEDGFQIWIDSVNKGDTSGLTTLDYETAYIHLGSTTSHSSIGTGDDFTMTFDMLEVDNDTMPTGCE